jgi:hypothetical protein
MPRSTSRSTRVSIIRRSGSSCIPCTSLRNRIVNHADRSQLLRNVQNHQTGLSSSLPGVTRRAIEPELRHYESFPPPPTATTQCPRSQ